MAKNKIINLNDHLFAQLERLNDESLKGEALKEEIERSNAVSNIATNIIKSGRLMLDARLAADTTVNGDKVLPAILGADFGPDSDTLPQKQ